MKRGMATSKYKIHDKVIIVTNTLQPQFQGKAGSIKKVYPAFSESESDRREFFYRIEVDGNALKGLARECDLKLEQ